MRVTEWCRFSLGGAVACAVAMASAPAFAGGFSVHEQSVSGLGSAFAGVAAGQDLSSMFWNAAATANVDGVNAESHATLALPDSTISATGGLALSRYGLDGESGDISGPALIGASYLNYQVNDRLYFGLAVNAPFGFTTKPDNSAWAGETFARTSRVFTFNVNPTVAYKVSSQLTIGAGLQVQYIDVTLSAAALPLSAAPTVSNRGYDVGVGATVGLLWRPLENTTIGLGYRSAVGVDLEGRIRGEPLPLPPPFPTDFATVGAMARFHLPEIVTASLRQRLSEDWTLLGSVEWSNWSRFGDIVIRSEGTGGYYNPLAGRRLYGPNDVIQTLDLDWGDGWLFSGGLEYRHDPRWTFRGGLGWELSPIDDSNRSVFLPDNDRLWLSGGFTHRLTERSTVDLAYAHIFFKDAPIDQSQAGLLPVTLQAEGHADIDLIAASFKYHLGGSSASPEESLK